MSGYNREQFQELLKKGIGFRTQKEFSEQSHIAAPTINKMLNGDPACPRVKTLEKLAKYMSNVSLQELMDACGYEMPTIEEKVAAMESSLDDYFQFAPPDGNTLFPVRSMDALAEGISGFFADDKVGVEIGGEKDIPETMARAGAEQATEFSVSWTWDTWSCRTDLIIYHTKAVSGKELVFGTDLDEIPEERKHYIRHTFVQTKAEVAAAELLLKRIFGEDGADWVPVTYAGWGFECNDLDPGAFIDFLAAHAASFCMDEENVGKFQRIMMGEDIIAVLAENPDCCPTLIDAAGPAIAEILSYETKEEFDYYTNDDRLPEEEQNRCIMVRSFDEDIFRTPVSPDIDQALLLRLFGYAKELHLPSFGAVYYRAMTQKRTRRMYKTDQFWLVEKEQKDE